MPRTNTAVSVALIAAAGAVIAAIVQFYPWHHPAQGPAAGHERVVVLSGAVVDETSNQGIPLASISIAGRPESYSTENTGNFRIVFPPDFPTDGSVRVRVAKTGYAPNDMSYSLPSEGNVIIMHRDK
jgi:hypothetical protein